MPSRDQGPSRSQHAFALGQSLNPYTFHYRRAFAFSAILYPHLQQLALQLACPRAEIRAYRVPFLLHERFRPCLSTGGHVLAYAQM